jgi:hypothetical protein
LGQALAAEVTVAPALVTATVTVLQAMKVSVRVTLAPVILVARASLPLGQTPKMARPALPAADWRRPMSVDKH